LLSSWFLQPGIKLPCQNNFLRIASDLPQAFQAVSS
jgi:hypothetical protein